MIIAKKSINVNILRWKICRKKKNIIREEEAKQNRYPAREKRLEIFKWNLKIPKLPESNRTVPIHKLVFIPKLINLGNSVSAIKIKP